MTWKAVQLSSAAPRMASLRDCQRDHRHGWIWKVSIYHPRHRGWLREGIVSAVTEMNGYEKLPNFRLRHRGWLRRGIVSAVTDMDMEAVQLSYAAPQTAAGKKSQCHPRRRGAVQEQDKGR